jgi:hypothetical protein
MLKREKEGMGCRIDTGRDGSSKEKEYSTPAVHGR